MRLRLRRLGIGCLICLGCRSLAGGSPPPPPAQALWEQGQQAMKAGEPERAITLYKESLAKDRGQERNHLSLAAAYLEKGDDRAACMHLGLFLQAHPEHGNAHFYYAELLLKLGRPGEAEAEFEQLIAFAQEEPVLDYKHLVHCHTRLIEVGTALKKSYLVHLHRGIGMILLAQQRAALHDPDGALSTEGLLCKGAAELSRANKQRPSAARPCWYLHVAWRLLGQHEPARRRLAEACRYAPYSYLTPTEQRDLALASRARLEVAWR